MTSHGPRAVLGIPPRLWASRTRCRTYAYINHSKTTERATTATGRRGPRGAAALLYVSCTARRPRRQATRRPHIAIPRAWGRPRVEASEAGKGFPTVRGHRGWGWWPSLAAACVAERPHRAVAGRLWGAAARSSSEWEPSMGHWWQQSPRGVVCPALGLTCLRRSLRDGTPPARRPAGLRSRCVLRLPPGFYQRGGGFPVEWGVRGGELRGGRGSGREGGELGGGGGQCFRPHDQRL